MSKTKEAMMEFTNGFHHTDHIWGGCGWRKPKPMCSQCGKIPAHPDGDGWCHECLNNTPPIPMADPMEDWPEEWLMIVKIREEK